MIGDEEKIQNGHQNFIQNHPEILSTFLKNHPITLTQNLHVALLVTTRASFIKFLYVQWLKYHSQATFEKFFPQILTTPISIQYLNLFIQVTLPQVSNDAMTRGQI